MAMLFHAVSEKEASVPRMVEMSGGERLAPASPAEEVERASPLRAVPCAGCYGLVIHRFLFCACGSFRMRFCRLQMC